MISQQTVQRINDAARIDEVVGGFVNLKKAGSHFKGLCPFHNEKTPSFVVSPAKGIYKCFGCGAAGNSSKFLMEHEHISYPEALRWLANKYNIEIEEDERKEEEFKQEQLKLDSIHIANGFAQRFFTEYLFDSEEGRSHGLTYFKERGFRDDTIKKFQLGFSPGDKKLFVGEALKQGYQKEVLIQAALAKESGTDLISFFRGRVMFPIHNLMGKVIAFGARILVNDPNAPKYVNTAESDVYQKSKILYGAFFAKNAISKTDECFLVEGYTDVISLHQGGIENVVASSGTSLTTDQVKLIRRFTNNITILYDGDAAGQKAALRGIEIILHEGMNVKLVLFPEDQDPDSFMRANGSKVFSDYIKNNSKDFFRFKLESLMKDSGNDPGKRSEIIHQMVESIALIEDPIKRHAYIKDCSEKLGVREEIISTETNKLRRKKYSKENSVSTQDNKILDEQFVVPDSAYQPELLSEFTDDFQERDIVRLLLEFNNLEIEENQTVAQFILSDLETIAIENPVYRKIMDEFRKFLENGEHPVQNYFLNHPDEEISKLSIELLYSQYEVSKNWEKIHDIAITEKSFLFKKDIFSSINRFKLRKVMRYLEINFEKVKNATTEEEQLLYMTIHHELLRKKIELAENAGNTVVVK